IPIRALQDELQKKYELCVSRMKAFKAKSAALNQVKGDYSQQFDGNNGIYPLAYAIVEKEITCS
ncbi:hypothetical protein Tco_0521642, partial [Tanacetum coccineum]